MSRPGRPTGNDSRDVRATLLSAARELFVKNGYEAVTTKAIAAHAGVNPAMIHYYFDNKAGLHQAMLMETVGPVLGQLSKWVAASGKDADLKIDAFVSTYMRTLAANPWLPQLMLREVLIEGGRLREAFIAQIASRAGEAMPQLMEQGIAAGRLRENLDAKLATLSLISMAAFPFLAAPVLGRVLHYEINDDFVEQLIDHTVRMFHDGAARRTEA